MKNKKENRRNREGFLWITVGLLLIAAALCPSLYNLYDSGRTRVTTRWVLTEEE